MEGYWGAFTQRPIEVSAVNKEWVIFATFAKNYLNPEINFSLIKMIIAAMTS